MADYKELLRRAVEALPENNGAARRAVYEKARAALVGQLRAIKPPLAARDITAHRLQLEDCIRQVEQEASEAVIAGLAAPKDEQPAPPAPVFLESSARKPATPAVAKPVAKAPPTTTKEPPKPLPPGDSIEEIIAAANAEHESVPDATRSIVRADGKPVGKPLPKLVPANGSGRTAVADARREEGDADEPEALEAKPAAIVPARGPVGRPVPSIVARAEAMRGRQSAAVPARGPVLEPRRELAAIRGAQQAAAVAIEEPVALFEEPPVAEAMSAVREVEVDAPVADPQGAIDRAIATLDREARGEPGSADEDEAAPTTKNGHAVARDEQSSILRATRESGSVSAASMVRNGKGKSRGRRSSEGAVATRSRRDADRGGIGAVTIFLIVFAVLLVGAGGAGIWAWREGYINLDTMFGRAAVTTEQAAAETVAEPTASAEAPATGPGNTETRAETAAPAAELGGVDRLNADAAADTPALALTETPAPTQERLTGEDTTAQSAAEAAVASVDPTALAGSQSLLLEASDSGTTGAVPFSGTVEWTKGTDETGLPTLIGKASIPARNLGVELLIRKNSDPSLPASHLMEVNFRVSESFIGGSIAGLPGVLLKNEELVQGTPLVGASARVVGNSFLFALSALPQDVASNVNMLMQRKWMDLALIYATGKRAIITLEKDSAAQALFLEVVQAWLTGGASASSG